MKIKFDKTADSLYLSLKKAKVHKTVEDGLVLMDVDKKGGLIGIEILNCSKFISKQAKKAEKRKLKVA
jgi:uncharacterized protein YuzE